MTVSKTTVAIVAILVGILVIATGFAGTVAYLAMHPQNPPTQIASADIGQGIDTVSVTDTNGNAAPPPPPSGPEELNDERNNMGQIPDQSASGGASCDEPDESQATSEREKKAIRAYKGGEPYTYSVVWNMSGIYGDDPAGIVAQMIFASYRKQINTAREFFSDDFRGNPESDISWWTTFGEYAYHHYLTKMDAQVSEGEATCMLHQVQGPWVKDYIYHMVWHRGWKIDSSFEG